MRNLADFKRALTLGSRWDTIMHTGKFIGRDENNKPHYIPTILEDRPVSIVQSNSVAFKTTRTDGTEVDSWLQWPKAKDCVFNDNEINVYQDGVLILTYKKRQL